ncbi:AlpA family transcriptional regulator [Pelomonas sp. KK5]|uniref:helix-turn-helix transcriptional regulator n=1 Tax=Pelomonas sp. KK5 TaxID=1855730 RepID=UPI00097C1915|nr:AlpA family transcriptional regulator [Pelomonas sp. KK5]
MQLRPYPDTVAEPSPNDILRLPAVRRTTGLGRSTIYRLMDKELFPRQIRIGERAVGWRRSDIDSWNATRPNAH